MSMDKDKIAYEQLLQGIQSYVNECLTNGNNRDITTTGRIVEVVEDGGYTVEINGIQYSDVDTIGGECTLNEMVRVMIPQGQYNNMFILKGGSTSSGTVTPPISTTDYAQLTNKPSINGNVLINNKTGSDLGLISESDQEVTDIDFSNYFN